MQRDPAFEKLLQSTQTLAKNIKQQHEQQQGPISPLSPAYHAQLQHQQLQQMLNFQQPLSFLSQHHHVQQVPTAVPQQLTASASALDYVQHRNISIDSDMAYDGIEELLIDSILDADQSKLTGTATSAMAHVPTQR